MPQEQQKRSLGREIAVSTIGGLFGLGILALGARIFGYWDNIVDLVGWPAIAFSSFFFLCAAGSLWSWVNDRRAYRNRRARRRSIPKPDNEMLFLATFMFVAGVAFLVLFALIYQHQSSS